MLKTYILGTGFLSNEIEKKITNSEILSANDFLYQIKKINKQTKKVNLIINSFYSSRELGRHTSLNKFIRKSLLEVSQVLDNINPKLIRKIIYTSSSSVYGSIINKVETNDNNNRYLYSSFKLAAETMIKNYCNRNKIYLDIFRIFNIYGDKDNFSII